MACRGEDLDGRCAYYTSKMVQVRDVRLGGLYYTSVVFCLVYLGFNIVMEKGFLAFSPILGSLDFDLVGSTENLRPISEYAYCRPTAPAPAPTDAPANASQPTPETAQQPTPEPAPQPAPQPARGKRGAPGAPGAPGAAAPPAATATVGEAAVDAAFSASPAINGSALGCLYMDGHDLVFPAHEEAALFVTTRVTYMRQRRRCGADAQSCAGAPLWTTAWREDAYAVGVEELNVTIVHSLYLPERVGLFTGESNEMDGVHLDHAGRAFGRAPKGDTDVIQLGALLRAAGVELDVADGVARERDVHGAVRAAAGAAARTVDNATARDAGVALVIVLDYSNTFQMFLPARMPRYSLSVHRLSQESAAVDEVTYHERGAVRELRHRAGVRIIARRTGTIGSFSLRALLLNIASGLVIVRTAKFVVDLIALWLHPDRARFFGWIFEQTELATHVKRKEWRVKAQVVGSLLQPRRTNSQPSRSGGGAECSGAGTGDRAPRGGSGVWPRHRRAHGEPRGDGWQQLEDGEDASARRAPAHRGSASVLPHAVLRAVAAVARLVGLAVRGRRERPEELWAATALQAAFRGKQARERLQRARSERQILARAASAGAGSGRLSVGIAEPAGARPQAAVAGASGATDGAGAPVGAPVSACDEAEGGVRPDAVQAAAVGVSPYFAPPRT
ncbi:hypothetical protein KFE25_013112 [Diacronema lutheri]|uniref:Uncharacterized protein n=1 Tax=Diacronema lutheri TaxID=2081491 RepID=A0A8J6C355_DIALT|nr:hypothetical protein KFE25_013112 [Diacronema lutheri]